MEIMNRSIWREIVVLALVLLVSTQVGEAQVSSDTRMWRYNLAQTSVYPGGPTTFPLNLKWKVDGSSYSSPVLADGKSYVNFGNRVYSYNATSGAQNWMWSPPSSESNSQVGIPTVASNGRAYFTLTYGASGGNKSKIYCIDANNKAAKWSYDAGFVLSYTKESSPISVYNNVAYALLNNGMVIALDATSGALKWNFNTGTRIQTAPAIAGGTLFVAPVGKLYAFNTSNGAVKWSKTIPGWTQSSPAVSGTTVVLGSNDGRLHAYDTNTGAVKWEYNTGAWVTGWLSSPAIFNNYVFVGGPNNQSKVYALNLANGILIWQYNAPGSTFASSPAFSNGVVYITSSNGRVLGLRYFDGSQIWSATMGSTSQSSPAIYNGRVYVCGNDTSGYQKLHSFGP
jgi:eukaryotic-like serine/threonine-protein kinase